MLSHRKPTAVECWADGKIHRSSLKRRKRTYARYASVYYNTLFFGVLCFLLPGVSRLNFLLVLSRPKGTLTQTSSLSLLSVAVFPCFSATATVHLFGFSSQLPVFSYAAFIYVTPLIQFIFSPRRNKLYYT